MFSSWVVRELHGYRAVTLHPPHVVCTERTKAASLTVTLNTIYVINIFNMTLQIGIAAKNNIIAISFFAKTRTVEMSPDEGQG
jgi:hypothetical protein